ncbi:RusA-like Holliday junction resolvase [Pantoea phage vB_PagM_LIET2]|uniref:DNA polymerase III beta subunit n=1 Tax=Pantoea phage vB_PagM_LIET2 TaxID=2508071 RepID=A0A411AW84_9CAUD|nr:RusA-like Holliday junction resolvase [Pantoea phage vB_PagM_LIET2]QAX92363.1 DNA polymerase III beta subunit [Pantoea phage vB_PagM_LIET2]UJH96010.1 DNA polymerase III subunit beta [Pantoea phage Nafs113]
MIFRIDKAVLESMHLLKAAPKAEWRTQLTGIIFEKDGTIWAGNGHVALVARTGKEFEEEMALDIDKTPAAGKKYQFAIIDTAQGTCSYIPPFEGIESATDEECIAHRLAMSVVKIISSNRIIKLSNPIPPKPEAVKEIVFDADYLALLPKVADLFSKQEGGKFAFSLTGSNTAALVKVRAGQSFKLTFILMPIVV